MKNMNKFNYLILVFFFNIYINSDWDGDIGSEAEDEQDK